jgi:hypothetical protein
LFGLAALPNLQFTSKFFRNKKRQAVNEKEEEEEKPPCRLYLKDEEVNGGY